MDPTYEATLAAPGTRLGASSGTTAASRPVMVVATEDAAVRRRLEALFGEAFSLVWQADVDQALTVALEFRPEMVILDVTDQLGDGESLLAGWREDPVAASTPLLLIAGDAKPEARLGLLRAGASEVLVDPFDEAELQIRVRNLMALRWAERTNLALEISGDRLRIAQDLHDLVVQRIFALGMRMTVLTKRTRDKDPALAGDLTSITQELDTVIATIRSSIFDLRHRDGGQGARSEVAGLVAEAAGRLGCRPRLVVRGAIDSLLDGDLRQDLIGTLREALANVVRHAQATELSVTVALEESMLVLEVVDNGVGIGEGPSGDGVGNMTARAVRHGGACRLRNRESGGAELRWSVPFVR